MRATFDPQLKQRKPEEGQVHLPAGSTETNNEKKKGLTNLISSHSSCRRHTFRSVSEFYHFQSHQVNSDMTATHK